MTGCKCRLNPLEHGGDPLTDADAHCHERVVSAGALQLARRGQRDAWPRSAERMADRDRSAVLVDPAVVERQLEPTQASEHLRGKGFVDLDYIDVRETEAGAGERLLRGGDRADPHDPRRDAG